MPKQQTLKGKVQYTGREFYGGNDVLVTISPAEENTGILFDTPRGHIKADINLASQSRSSIMLKEGRAKVIHVEHLLATLFAYGIDNARISLKRNSTMSFKALKAFGLATEVEVVPTSQDRELTLCEKIEEAGLEKQLKERRILTIFGPVYTPKLSFDPIEKGLVVKATTNYPKIGGQSAEFEITPFNYKNELSQSRMFVKHSKYWVPQWFLNFGASLAYPAFGLGHGFTKETVFLPVKTREEWKEQEIYPAEIARHTIIDRLGAIALLDGRLEGVKVCAKYSGHANDLTVLREIKGLLRSQ